jgi:hypothetical protein
MRTRQGARPAVLACQNNFAYVLYGTEMLFRGMMEDAKSNKSIAFSASRLSSMAFVPVAPG